MAKVLIISVFLILFTSNCSNNTVSDTARTQVQSERIEEQSDLNTAPSEFREARPAAFHTKSYVPRLNRKRVALVVNQTSTIGDVHLVDSLQRLGLDLKKIFAPEHGFRGAADAGATIKDGIDQQSGLPIKSLYGKNKKPSAQDLANIDVIVFDIQDVGARFYTYISTLFYVMEAAATHNKEVMVLDRPNPNGHLIDGPVLKPEFSSFVGIAPIPVAHGLTVGEFARMVNGEGWLPEGKQARLTVIPMQNYSHELAYELPVAPSPNLPNARSIYLYPSLCFFEGTAVSVGRGTYKQFQLYGHPSFTAGDIRFTPTPGPGSASPKLEGKLCRGFDLTLLSPHLVRRPALQLDYLVDAYRDLDNQGVEFFTRPDFFDLLAGTDELRQRIIAGDSAEAIRAGWAAELADYRLLRSRYTLYP
ncbi:DUF1343 domain-containing protein [Neolewinella aurantiaca]|uniref:DUF1343 domain-containing protein n=1 Tax=Neolewinella aurantiaca TaxID=2602767 RepID=A0A5C7FTB8_9BACT|nr:DUF1343 domain-containing protein [Neolewinella aurantiaca]TXF91381.1 DUF1343 domain-containing protein [Neolewinella aurantiaca]